MTNSESFAKLQQVLSKAEVTATEPLHGKAFLDFLTKASIGSVDDFIGYVSEASYETEWKEFCTFTDGVQNKDGELDRVLWARVKKAWEILNTIKKGRKGDQASLNDDKVDDPLPQLTLATLADLWKARHDLELDPHMRPADALIARIYREINRNTASLIDISKVRSLIHAAAPEVNRQVALDGQISLNFTEGAGSKRSIGSTTAYYFGLRILGYAYAYAGNELVLSKANPTEKVLNCPLNVNINYADRALRLAHDLALSESSKLVWLRARDVETRSTMIGLMRQGWPQGEALTKAQKEHALEWASGPKQKSDADTSAELLGGERDRGRHDRQGQQKRKFLSDWQQRSGDGKSGGKQKNKDRSQRKGNNNKGNKGKGRGKW
jgi:hypothetical protein